MGEFELRTKKVWSRARDTEVLMLCSRNTVQYISNYVPLGPVVAIVPRDGKPSLLITQDWDLDRAKELSFINDIRVSDNDLWQDSKKILEEKKVLKAKIGLVGEEEMSVKVHQAFKKVFSDIKFELVDKQMRRASACLTEMEIKMIRKACECCEVAWEAIIGAARVGIKHYELQAEAEYAVRRLGADNFNPFGVGQGPEFYAMVPGTDKKVEEGDRILGEITPSYRGYSAQLIRTAVIGEIPTLVKERYEYLLEGMKRAIAIIKPGISVSELAKIQNNWIARAGFMEYCREPFMAENRGHGSVVIQETNETKLEEGMTFVVHPNQYFPDIGYLGLGDQVLVTKDGVEVLTKTELGLFSVPL